MPEQTAQSVPVAPPSPGRSFAWAAAWALVAAIGFFVLSLEWRRVLNSDISGQRTEGVILFTPIAAVIVGVVMVVIGVRGIVPTRNFRARWSAEERAGFERQRLAGQSSTPFIVFALCLAVLWLAGMVVVFGFLPHWAQRPSGLGLALELLALLAMAWVSLLMVGLRRRR